MGTVTIHRSYFTEEEVWEGDAPRTVETEVHDGLTAREAADMLTREGLTFAATGNDWAADPDGSRIVNYGTGLREETSGHLSDFPDRVAAAIADAVG